MRDRASLSVVWVSIIVVFVVSPLLAIYALGHAVQGLVLAVLLAAGSFVVFRRPSSSDVFHLVWVPTAWVVMLLVSDHQFIDLGRSPLEAAKGNASPENLLEVCVYVVVAAMVLRSRRFLVSDAPYPIPKLPLLLFPGFALLSTLWSPIPAFSFARAGQLVVLAALALLMVRLWQVEPEAGEDLWVATVRAFIQLVSVLALTGLILGTSISGRFTWPGTHPVVASSWAGAALVVLVLGGRRFLPVPAWSYVPRLFLFVVVLALGVTRSVYAGIAIAGLVVLWDLGREKPIARYLGLWYYGTAALGLFVLARAEVVSFLSRGESSEVWSTLNGRIPLWESAVHDVAGAGAWVQGLGYGTARVVLFPEFAWAGTAHNSWFEALLGVGIIGSVLLLVDVLYVLWRLSWRSPPGRSMRLALAVVVYLVVLSGTSELLAIPGLGYGLLALMHVPAVGPLARSFISRDQHGVLGTSRGRRSPALPAR